MTVTQPNNPDVIIPICGHPMNEDVIHNMAMDFKHKNKKSKKSYKYQCTECDRMYFLLFQK